MSVPPGSSIRILIGAGTMKNTMGKIGIVNLCHKDYLDETVEVLFQNAVDTVRQTGVELVLAPEYVWDFKDGIKAGVALCGQDLDGVILFLGSWIECSAAMAVLREVEHLPLLLWGVPMFEAKGQMCSTGSYVSFAMFKGSMTRAGYVSEDVLGLPEDSQAQEKITDFCCAARAKKLLKRQKIGLIGYSSMNIYPGTFDHLFLRTKIGPEVEQMDAYTVIGRAQDYGREALLDGAAKIGKAGEICTGVSEKALLKTAGIYLALRELCYERQWDAFNIKCQYEFSKEYRAVPCVPVGMLADEGVVASCEGDMLCTVSMMMLSLLSGQVVTYGDAINHTGNVLKISSCGMLPFSMGFGQRHIRKFMPHDGFHGIQASFVMRPEKVTLLRLVEDCGSYHLLYGTGMGQSTQLRQGYMPALDILLDGSMENLVRHYAGQHFAVCYGDYAGKLETLAAMMGIDTVKI